MGTTVIHRPARIPPPAVEAEEIKLAPPPKLMHNTGGGHAVLGGGAGVGGLASLGVAFSNNGRPLFVAISLIVGIVFISIAIITVIVLRSGPRKQLRNQRERYLDYVDGVRQRLRASVSAQRARAEWLHPEPARLIDVAGDETRRWERRSGDDDFLSLRIGTGSVPLELRVSFDDEDNPLEEHEQVSL